MLSKRKAIFQRKSSVQSGNRMNHLMSKPIAQTLLHLAIGVTQIHFQLILFSSIYNPARAPSLYHYFRTSDKFQNAQHGTFMEAKTNKQTN